MHLFLRRSVFAFVLGGALVAAVLLGRSAFATTDTINACFKPSNGTLYLLGDGTGRSQCQPGDIPISWNTAGVNGQDGVSVTSQRLAPGDDPACPAGGSKFTAANGDSYACNGTNGQNGQNGRDGQDGRNGVDGTSVTNVPLAPGDDPACPNGGTKFTGATGVSYACNGTNGQDGQSFSGTFTSPNGLYRLVVDNTSAKIQGPSGSVQITAGNLQIQSAGLLTAAAPVMTIGTGTSQIFLNGPGCGVLRSTDVNPFIPPQSGGATLLNPNGSANVRTPC
jgi:hypothetical protein